MLLPHAGRMILLDRVTGYDETTVEAELAVRPSNPFFEAGKGIAAHIAIEWMAQACAAFVGLEALRNNQPVRVGFLLGTRNFRGGARLVSRRRDPNRCGRSWFSRMAKQGCSIVPCGDAAVAARAQLTLHQPADLAAVLKQPGYRRDQSG